MSNKSVINGIFWSFGERLTAQVVSFVVSIILARMLSPTDYGVVAVLLIFIGMADIFVSNGFGTALIQKKDADELDFSTLFYCGLTTSMIIYLLIFVTAPCIARFYNNDAIVLLMRVLAVRIPISAYNTIQRAFVSRHMIFKKFFFSTLIGTILSAFIGIFLAWKGYGAWALIAQNLGNAIIDSIVLTFIVTWRPSLVFSLERAKQLMSYGWKVLFAGVIGGFFDQIQSLIIGKAFSPADLAFYEKGNQIPTIISSNVSNSVMTVLFPAVANYSDDYGMIRKLTRQATCMMAYVTFPLMFGLAFVSRPVIVLLLTDKWVKSAEYMSILCFSVAFALIGNVGLQTIKATGRSDLLLKIELYKKPVFLLLILIGLKYGVRGVAIASTVYSFYAMLVNFGTMGKIINYSFREQIKDVVRVALLSVGMSIFVWLCNYIPICSNLGEILIKVVVGASCYIALSYFTNNEEFHSIINYIQHKIIHK